MNFKKILALTVSAVLLSAALLTGCGNGGSSSGSADSVTIAMQNGMSYAPLTIMKEQGLVEKYCEGVDVRWVTLNSGSAINEGMASGEIDFGGMGVAPAITAVASGLDIKIASSLDSLPNRIMTNDPAINALSDIKPDDKIALVNIGSLQHILLAMAAKNVLGDAKALDNNIVAMSHPDGMTALTSGSVDMQLTNPPYLFEEQEDSSLHEVEGLAEICPVGTSTIVLTATSAVHENAAVYDGVMEALNEAMDYINEDPAGAAEILAKTDDLDPVKYQSWLEDESTVFSTKCHGVMDFVKFMDENGFMDSKAPASFSELVFDNVEGD